MRIDRRGSPSYPVIPDIPDSGSAGDTEENHDRLAIRTGGSESDQTSLIDVFSELDCKDCGFFTRAARLFDAVGRALREIRQGNSRTFD